MIPTPWIALVLALGTFRIVRLIGWDDWPYALRMRHWLGGRNEGNRGVQLFPQTDPRGFYTHPTMMKFLVCPWCQGFWCSCIVYALWIFVPTEVLYGLAPFALSAAVGLIASRLDP